MSGQASATRAHQAALSSAQHAAQRVAANGIAVKQCGQSLVVGASLFRLEFTALIMMKITNATIAKFTMSLMKAP